MRELAVAVGPTDCASVRNMLVMPMTAVLSSGLTTAAMNAARGAWSKEFRAALNIKRLAVHPTLLGNGTNPIARDDGK